jgi:hypothetical protein
MWPVIDIPSLLRAIGLEWRYVGLTDPILKNAATDFTLFVLDSCF